MVRDRMKITTLPSAAFDRRTGDLIRVIMPVNKYGCRVNIRHPHAAEHYAQYRKEHGSSLNFPADDKIRHGFEEEYIAALFALIPVDKRPADIVEAYVATHPEQVEEGEKIA